MAFERDHAVIAALRARPENAGVLDAVDSTSAHGDLGEVLFRYARSTGAMRVIPMAAADFPALVATRADDDVVVAAATGMHSLLVRTKELPEPARLSHERAPDLGEDWWHVHPFDAQVSSADIAEELQRWFIAASRWA
jgi:hypothetical protein